ncbi:MAG TPA: hypothetical protein QF753_08020 [Victivallales bacterium]|nr:hypothetical protein [Victivallales bacterium]
MKISYIVNSYITAVKNKNVIISALIYASYTAILYGTIAIIPFISAQDLKMSPKFFGIIFFLSYMGYLVSSILATSLSGKFKTVTAIIIGIGIAFCANLILIAFYSINYVTITSVFSYYLSVSHLFLLIHL